MIPACKPMKYLVVFAATIAFAATAGADRPADSASGGSCSTLFSNLRLELAKPQTNAWVVWTTNYFAPERQVHFIGDSKLKLTLQGQDVVGVGSRSEQYFDEGIGNSQTNKTSSVSFRLRADGKIVLNERYGPFEPVCASGKFALILGPESVETYSFKTFVPRQFR